jgi:hypothetical protein
MRSALALVVALSAVEALAGVADTWWDVLRLAAAVLLLAASVLWTRLWVRQRSADPSGELLASRNRAGNALTRRDVHDRSDSDVRRRFLRHRRPDTGRMSGSGGWDFHCRGVLLW